MRRYKGVLYYTTEEFEKITSNPAYIRKHKAIEIIQHYMSWNFPSMPIFKGLEPYNDNKTVDELEKLFCERQ